MAKDHQLSWGKLDNTALLFPVIANTSMTNVYRISVVLTEDVDRIVLQDALNRLLPRFPLFRMRLKAGFFWYYFEESKKNAPIVREEYSFPGAYINRSKNNQFMFRVTYYGRRINLEVFHALTDGFGGVVFLKELTYQYLRIKHHDELWNEKDDLSNDVYLDQEDSYIKNYKEPEGERKKYPKEKALVIKGEMFPKGEIAVIHMNMSVKQLKEVSKSYGVTINSFLVGVYVYSIYKNYLNGNANSEPIICSVPINLRPFYDSHTLKNFFIMINSTFRPERNDHSLEEVIKICDKCIKEAAVKENIDNIISYNVSNETNIMLRAVPLFIKNFAIKQVYDSVSHNTTTLTNIGNISFREPYKEFVESCSCLLSMSDDQNIKCGVCSCGDTFTATFSSCLTDTGIQKCFAQTLAGEGLELTIETNGVYGY